MSKSLTISGTLVDCDSNPVSNGYVKINFEGGYNAIFVEEDGTFNQTISICSASEVSLTGIDIDNLLQSETATYNVEGLSELDAGTLTACDELEEFFTYTIDDGSVHVLNDISMEIATDSMGGVSAFYIFGLVDSSGMNTGSSTLGVEAGDVGVYNPIYMQLWDNNSPNGNGAFCQGGCDSVTVTITAFGDIDEPIIGSFDGTLESGGGMVSVSGSFKVIRRF